MRVLGFESSCDETAVAVVDDGHTVRASVVQSQDDLHQTYGGVVPEIAGRAHAERIGKIVDRALAEANTSFSEIDAVAVAHRPGLIGSVLVGVAAAKSVAWRLGIPLIGVHHVEAHLWSGLLEQSSPPWPALGLVVSGGHSSLYRIDAPFSCTVLGRTIDDAVGEAYDKAAALLGLGWPGGVRVDRAAQHGDDDAYQFPMPNLKGRPLDFSFSGLKTAVRYGVLGLPGTPNRDPDALSDQERADAAASFQKAAVRTLIRGLRRARQNHADAQSLLIGGGVSANSRLRKELETFAQEEGLELRIPPMKWCVDNAAMVAGLGWIRLQEEGPASLSLAASPR
ncbi:MAG: tRNA (adenosine(37)-N6)-threonylcarbamoyltransferase complex transferase subunit TsaD [Phycisphaerae bacterium]|jgi:N6-L-threonylcarbamoyladenine synthase|nr:tRNA (adenosine(37)-N6)-threonylcarbamoyltransferase complex transferase subunit TsaD [Phycisphaerae bacterium]